MIDRTTMGVINIKTVFNPPNPSILADWIIYSPTKKYIVCPINNAMNKIFNAEK
jgi:hypothetical protein